MLVSLAATLPLFRFLCMQKYVHNSYVEMDTRGQLLLKKHGHN